MTTSGITNINAKLIHQHPDNPRKDLGDLTELSESIKKKGIMQNLTVIPGHWDEDKTHHDEGYARIEAINLEKSERDKAIEAEKNARIKADDEIKANRAKTLDAVKTTTKEGTFVDALAVKELSEKMDGIDVKTENLGKKIAIFVDSVVKGSVSFNTSDYLKDAYIAIKWSEVENATSYKVRITKADGTWKEYDTTYTAFYNTNYTDDFIANGMDGATVRVRAYGDNDTFGCWSDDTNIARFGY